MKRLIVAAALLGPCGTALAGETTRAGIPLDAAWKKNLYGFAQKNSTQPGLGSGAFRTRLPALA